MPRCASELAHLGGTPWCEQPTLNLPVGATGRYRILKKDLLRREYIVELRDTGGQDIPNLAWGFDEVPCSGAHSPEDVMVSKVPYVPPPEEEVPAPKAEPPDPGGAPRCLAEGRRGWFPASFCSEDGALGGRGTFQVSAPFDGREYGPEYLTCLKGARILRTSHPDEGQDKSWAFGVLLGHNALAEGPAVGWLPAGFCGEDRAERGYGALRAHAAFDGQEYGGDYLTFPKGALLVRMHHQEEGGAWVFGALLAGDGDASRIPS